eukprot:scaffold3068_cov401-Prasinococcus_capsulatus_cf.AAC.24
MVSLSVRHLSRPRPPKPRCQRRGPALQTVALARTALLYVGIALLCWSTTYHTRQEGPAPAPGARRLLEESLNRKWWAFIVIPLMSGVVGFITNVVAVQMTFYPIKMWPLSLWAPKGSPIGILGWQGIIPAKADKMVRALSSPPCPMA